MLTSIFCAVLEMQSVVLGIAAEKMNKAVQFVFQMSNN